MKGRASTSVQCAPVRRVAARKKKSDPMSKECAETQTVESSVHGSDSVSNCAENFVNRHKISVGIDAANPGFVNRVSFWSHENLPVQSENVGEAVGIEMSVQTDEVLASNQYSTIETQTMCSNEELLSLFDTEDGNDLFLELNMNDIETQTNWNEMDGAAKTIDASTCIDEFLKDFNF